MGRNTRIAVVAFVALLGGGCAVQLADIQATQPIRTVAFTGSHVQVAQCLGVRLRVKLESPYGEALTSRETLVLYGDALKSRETLVLYNSTPRWAKQGVSHYSLTVKKTGASEGTVEWRVINQQQIPELDKAFAVRFWAPVERCIEDARKTS